MFKKFSNLKLTSFTFLFLGILCFSLSAIASSDPIIITGSEIDFDGEPGKNLTISLKKYEGEDVTGLKLSFSERNIAAAVGTTQFLESFSNYYSQVKELQERPPVMEIIAGESIQYLNAGHIIIQESFLKAGTFINLESNEKIDCLCAIAEAEEIIDLTASEFNLKGFFAKAETVSFNNLDSSPSWLIGFSISNSIPIERPFHFGFSGNINFESESVARSSNDNTLFVAGSSEITFHLRNPEL